MSKNGGTWETARPIVKEKWQSPKLQVWLYWDEDGVRSYTVQGAISAEDSEAIHEWFYSESVPGSGSTYPTGLRDRLLRMTDPGWWIGLISRRAQRSYRDWEERRDGSSA